MSNCRFVDPLTEPQWDRFVSNHPSGVLTHLSGWKKLLEGTFSGMKGFHVALFDASSKEIKAAVPVFLQKNWLSGSKLVSVPFGTLCGPLVTNAEDLVPLVDTLLDLASNLGASSLELRTYGKLSLLNDDRLGKSDYFRHHCLFLKPGPDILKNHFHRSCVRQKIDRALNSGLKLRIGHTEAELLEFYRLHLIMRKKQGLLPHPYRFFELLWKTFSPEGHVELLLVEDGDHIPAGLMLFKFNGRVSAEILAHDESSRLKSPNHFLFWEAIKRSCAENYTVFDFGRTAPDNETLMAFKGRWGTQVETMPTYFFPDHRTSSESSVQRSKVRILVGKFCKYAPEKFVKHAGTTYYNHFM